MLKDKRDYYPDNGIRVVCRRCGAENQEYQNCFNCKQPLFDSKINLTIGYQYSNGRGGKVSYTSKEETAKNEFVSKHGEDLIQPMEYSKSEHKNILNPEFTKRYGNPYKKAEVGTMTDKAVDAGSIVLNNPE